MPKPVDEQNALLGKRIREERKQRGLTLDKLGRMIGRSPGYLSQIENGVVNINISNLEAIGRALGVPLITFFMADGNDLPISVVRRSERRWFNLGAKATESLLVKSRGQLEIFVIRLQPGSDSVHESSHPGEEFSYVISGSVRVILDEAKMYDLGEGDVVYYRSEVSHLWQNITDREAEILVVNTPATY